MTVVTRLMVAAAMLALSGCWGGKAVFPASESVQPLPPGLYRLFDSERDFPDVRASVEENGLTRVYEDSVLGFVPLDNSNRLFVAWVDSEGFEPGSVLYLLMERRSDREFLFYYPVCEGRSVRLASRDNPGLPAGTCELESADEIRAGMSGLSPGPENVAARLVAR